MASRALLVLSAIAAPLAAQGVLTVSPSGSAMFTTIQAAVNAIVPGDTVLVRTGSYVENVTINKSLTLTMDAAATSLAGTLTVTGLRHGERVLLNGVRVMAAAPVVAVTACAGDVWIQGCVVLCASGNPFGSQVPAIAVADCAAVVLQDCDAYGATGDAALPGAEGSALSVLRSSVYANDCILWGGSGAPGADGAAAIRVDSGSIYLSDCLVRGGYGGPVSAHPAALCHPRGGDGGVGVAIAGATSVLTYVDAAPQGGGGGGGPAPQCPNPAGAPGLPVTAAGGATVVAFPGSVVPGFHVARSPSSPVDPAVLGVARVGEPRELRVVGTPGDLVILGIALKPEPIFFPFIRAPLLLGTSFVAVPLGAIAPSGGLGVPFTAPGLSSGALATTLFLQIYTLNAQGVLGGPGFALTVLDAAL